MSTSRELWRATAPLLAAMVVVQSVVVLVPHQHNPQMLADQTGLIDHALSAPHHVLVPTCQRSRTSACLACMVTPLAFAQPDEEPILSRTSTSPVIASLPIVPPALPLPWRHPHRGPPLRA